MLAPFWVKRQERVWFIHWVPVLHIPRTRISIGTVRLVDSEVPWAFEEAILLLEYEYNVLSWWQSSMFIDMRVDWENYVLGIVRQQESYRTERVGELSPGWSTRPQWSKDSIGGLRGHKGNIWIFSKCYNLLGRLYWSNYDNSAELDIICFISHTKSNFASTLSPLSSTSIINLSVKYVFSC